MSDTLNRVKEHPTLSPEAKLAFYHGWRRGELERIRRE